MARLRIASIYETLHLGGDEARLLSFFRALDKSRYEHVLVLLEEPPEERVERLGTVRPNFERHGMEVVPLGRRNPAEGKLARGRRVLAALARLLRHREIEIVDGRMGYGIIFGSLGGRQAGVSGISATEYNTETFWQRPGFKHLGMVGMGLADALICDSRTQLDKIQAWLPRPHPRPMVIQNGIFPPAPAFSREEMRHKLGLPGEHGLRVIASLGRMVPYKGHHLLLEAAPKILAAVPDVVFLCCGFRAFLDKEVGYPEQLVEQAARLGIADRVRVTSYHGPNEDLWAAIDLLVHPSLLDSSPITIHEAMAARRPAVVTSVGGVPELVTNGETALMVEPNDAGAIAEAAIRILKDPVLSERLAERSHARYQERHHARVMTGRLCELYDELHARARGRRSSGARR